jgi:histidyl-tRNA synthetase
LKGFKDIFEDEIEKHRRVEAAARKYLHCFGFKEIEVPLLERTELFARGIGESTDIVEKEMFTFTDKGGDSVSLRPEATAGVVRAYIQHGLYEREKVTKLFTVGHMFRYERPQRGRLREFRQINVEVFGVKEPLIEAELIFMNSLILKELGIEDYKIEINSVGCEMCRVRFVNVLRDYLRDKKPALCEDCQRRLERSPLRIFDCKKESCGTIIGGAPLISESLCTECRTHLERLAYSLSALSIEYVLNPRLVRGLDYYTRTVFEVSSDRLGAQKAFIAGGRYDSLVGLLGGPPVPGVGFAIGIERTSLLLPPLQAKRGPLFFFASVGENARGYLYPLLRGFAVRGIPLTFSYEEKSLKAQMRYADSLGADVVMILGEEEIERQVVVLRDMHKGQQMEVRLDVDTILRAAISLRERNFFDFSPGDVLNMTE